MPKKRLSKSRGRAKKVAIVASKFNDFITRRLLNGCLIELPKLGVKATDVTVVWVPGSFEIPVAALKCARRKDVDAVIGLGAVIRGETIHFSLVSRAAAEGMSQVSLLTGKPVVFGVITTDTVDQAYKRSEPKGDNKGRDAARTAVEMIDTLNQI
ncbi:MAG: 6,7-dimethyl-8-ribityllumazine synthase [Candidatus Omnitrophota bacterium]|nr:6,7-dimethyl-8-ribityllumazine synthase [Candidatus Omnitrophota bacterium]MDZ4241346.1 6,7-dimethyl-8-ribityllumazine synthase [Candidatus Omnitrophota bacterium]